MSRKMKSASRMSLPHNRIGSERQDLGPSRLEA